MHQQLAQLYSAISAVVSECDAESLTQHPEGRWSSAEILEHLNLTYLGTIKNLERRLAEDKPTVSPRATFSLRRLAVTRFGYFPRGRKSPERVTPRGTPSQQVTAEILQNMASMDDLISRCESRFPPNKAIADHPVLGPLTAKEWRGFHATHGLHHVKQIRALISRSPIPELS